MPSDEQKVGAISTFLQSLEKIDTRKGGILYYRGHSKLKYQLEPTLYRNPGWVANEATMLRELILRCPNDFSGGLSTFQTLVKMQHYSLPTRLLDLTSNPLVALHFACAIHDEGDEDGEVIVFGFDVDEVKYFDSDTVCVLANLSRRASGFKRPPLLDIGGFNECEEIKLLLHDVRRDRPNFQPAIRPNDLGKVICVKPLLDNPRIIRQDGAFLLFGIDGEKSKAAPLTENAVVGRIRINRDKKKELVTQLETLGFSRATMFPEIEHVATHIKAIYQTPDLEKLNKLSEPQARVIKLLAKGLVYTVNDVARQIKVPASSVSQSISKLSEHGFVERIGSGRNVRWRAIEAVREWIAQKGGV